MVATVFSVLSLPGCAARDRGSSTRGRPGQDRRVSPAIRLERSTASAAWSSRRRGAARMWSCLPQTTTGASGPGSVADRPTARLAGVEAASGRLGPRSLRVLLGQLWGRRGRGRRSLGWLGHRRRPVDLCTLLRRLPRAVRMVDGARAHRGLSAHGPGEDRDELRDELRDWRRGPVPKSNLLTGLLTDLVTTPQHEATPAGPATANAQIRPHATTPERTPRT
jgi:hypothetical protein